MPRYDYECEACHHRFELRQSFDSEPVTTCPECQNKAIRKFHAVPIVFKGSGWYVNDYGKKSSSSTSSVDSKRDGASETTSSSESKAEPSKSSSDSSNGSSESTGTSAKKEPTSNSA